MFNKINIRFFFCVMMFVCSWGLPLEAQMSDTSIYKTVDIPAVYVYGQSTLLRDIRNHIDYNGTPTLITLKGRLRINYVVEKNGCISQISTFPTGCEKEIIRLFDMFPGWLAAIKDGRPVRSLNEVSLYFNLH